MGLPSPSAGVKLLCLRRAHLQSAIDAARARLTISFAALVPCADRLSKVRPVPEEAGKKFWRETRRSSFVATVGNYLGRAQSKMDWQLFSNFSDTVRDFALPRKWEEFQIMQSLD